MSILINGMEMPKKCIECRLMRRCGKDDLDFVCMPASIYVEDLTNAYKPRPDFCPLVPVPPHGRLIDADKIYDAVEQRYRISSGIEHRCERDLLDLICSAPTILEAEEGET